MAPAGGEMSFYGSCAGGMSQLPRVAIQQDDARYGDEVTAHRRQSSNDDPKGRVACIPRISPS